jgi:hypothetical protein
MLTPDTARITEIPTGLGARDAKIFCWVRFAKFGKQFLAIIAQNGPH